MTQHILAIQMTSMEVSMTHHCPKPPHLLGQRHDDIPQVGQGPVDVLSLCQPRPLRPRLLQPLGPSQVHQVQRSCNNNTISKLVLCVIVKSTDQSLILKLEKNAAPTRNTGAAKTV